MKSNAVRKSAEISGKHERSGFPLLSVSELQISKFGGEDTSSLLLFMTHISAAHSVYVHSHTRESPRARAAPARKRWLSCSANATRRRFLQDAEYFGARQVARRRACAAAVETSRRKAKSLLALL